MIRKECPCRSPGTRTTPSLPYRSNELIHQTSRACPLCVCTHSLLVLCSLSPGAPPSRVTYIPPQETCLRPPAQLQPGRLGESIPRCSMGDETRMMCLVSASRREREREVKEASRGRCVTNESSTIIVLFRYCVYYYVDVIQYFGRYLD